MCPLGPFVLFICTIEDQVNFDVISLACVFYVLQIYQKLIFGKIAVKYNKIFQK